MIIYLLLLFGGMYFAWYIVPSPPTWLTKLKNNVLQWANKNKN